MTNQSILLLILIVLLSLGLSYLQYYYFSKKRNKNNFLLFLLRFFTYLTVGVLLLNPKLESTTTSIQKRNLILLIDNSSSIERIGDTTQVKEFVNTLSADAEINEKFNVQKFKFGEEFTDVGNLDFKDQQTKIYDALQAVNQVFAIENDPIVLLSDGNQSLGLDYTQFNNQTKASIFSVVVGDTLPVFDSKIDLVNANNYSFLDNLFPVEVFVSYNGSSSVQTQLQLFQNNKLLASKQIEFNEANQSQEVQFQIEAKEVGLQLYSVVLQPLQEEKFKENNNVQFGVEVIDERAKIALITSVLHPDVGMLKRSIETNKQREVDVKLVGKDEINVDDYQAFIWYQPNSSFDEIIRQAEKKQVGTFTITGTQTDYSFLNNLQEVFQKEIVSSSEEYYPDFNSNFLTFQFEDIGFSSFPPLKDAFGQVSFTDTHQDLLFQKVNGISTEVPMLFSYTKEASNHLVLFGENSWRWRSQLYANQEDFKAFDNFISSLIQFISTNDYKQRMIVEAESFYNEGENSQLKAKFYDANYKLLPTAEISIEIKNEDTGELQQFPMLLLSNSYVFNTAGLSPGNYSYKLTEKQTQIQKEGSFSVVSYSIENQFINPDVARLKEIAISQKLNYLNEAESLKNQLLNTSTFKPIQTITKNNQSLINSFYLFIFLALTLFLEWFFRKYQGLI